jgi:RNA polymerase sigma factor (sigma-70 family)
MTPTSVVDILDLRTTATRVVRARRPGPDEEDIIQEAWATACLAVRDRDISDPSAYTAATAANLVRLYGRREAAQRRRAARLFMRSTVDPPEAEIVHREEEQAMALALSRLAPAARELLVAHTIQGTDTAALARAMGSTPAAIAASLARARAALRVEYLIAFRRLLPPDERCKRILYALSGADSRRQQRLDAMEHVTTCPCCGPLADGLRDRERAGIGAIIGMRVARWMSRLTSVDSNAIGQRLGGPAGVLGAAGLLGVGVLGVLTFGPSHAPAASPAAQTVTVAAVAQPVLHPATALAHKARPHHTPGKKSAISLDADSGPSLPCTKFSVTSVPKSPRMVPGAASIGFVEPIKDRTTRQVSAGPSSTRSIAGPLVMKETKSPKNGLPSCSS